MKLLVGIGLVLALLGGGLWWSLRRQPSAAPLDDPGSTFTVQASGPGQLITFQAAQIPLRSLHWLVTLPGGILAAQVLSQSDRQRVVLFRDGMRQDTLLVLKPVGVGDGFWRFAALREAALVADGTLLLLYQPGDPGSTELPLALALDVASQQVRWFIRGDFTRMAVTPGSEAVYLFGGKGPIQRVALNQPSLHPAPTTIDLPPELQQVEALLPTGAASFLASHRNGLSCYRNAAWTHFPAPEEPGVNCPDFHSGLARAGKDIWWQALPGQMVKVHPDGTPGLAWRGELPEADAFAKDARLLRLLGADPSGALWFALASPAPTATQQPPANPPDADVPPAEDWGAYAAAGLDRLYRWNPARKALERIALPSLWPTLNPPPGMAPPALGQGLVPAAGALLAEGARCAWWLPLGALRAQAM